MNGIRRETMASYPCSRLVFAAVFWLGASPLAAQVIRLPATLPADQSYPGRLISHPDSSDELLQMPGEAGFPEQPERHPGARAGVFQKLIFSSTWLAGGGNDNLEMIDLELQSVLAFPFPSRESPLIVTPGFAVRYLQGPVSPDLPPQVYDSYAQFRWMHQVTPRLGIDLAVTPGLFSDFEQSSDEAVRITGHGIAAWSWTPAAKIVLGASYLDREDIGVLPIGGLIWTPNQDTTFELMFPRPRLATRLYWRGAYTDEVQDWLYVAGELGGGTWAIRRTGGADDVFNYRDFRVVLGLERKALGRLGQRLEVGYAFARKIEYKSSTPELEPPGCLMLRGALTY